MTGRWRMLPYLCLQIKSQKNMLITLLCILMLFAVYIITEIVAMLYYYHREFLL